MWWRAAAGPSLYSWAIVGRVAQRHRAAHRPLGANVARELAGVDVGDDGDARRREPVGERAGRPPVRRLDGQLAHDDARDPRAVGFDVVRVDAVVADHRGRHHDDLTEVGGIGEDLLVTRQIGCEDDLRVRGLEREGRGSGEPGSVLEQHVGRTRVSDGAAGSGWRVAARLAATASSAGGGAWAVRAPAWGRCPRAPSEVPRRATTSRRAATTRTRRSRRTTR